MTKTRKICYVLSQFGPMDRISILANVWEMDGRPVPFKPRSNNCYFLPRASGDAMGSQAWRQSLLVRGLIRVVGKRGNSLLYGLTAKGRRLAKGFAG